jgi:phage tail-like protein
MKALGSARNANNATWYLLRYASDFEHRAPDPSEPSWVPPALPDGKLFYDDARHVLELRPAAPAHEAEPPLGLAVDVDGQVYRVEPGTRRLLLRRCDGSEELVVCEPGVLLAPAGLALDRRGFLYVADPPAHRVLVVQPDDGSPVGILAGGLREPVDVAVSPDGWIFVADREAGLITVFNSRFERCAAFAPRNGEGEPAAPRPIAVMVEADGALLVADARHPRLLRFSTAGEPLGEAELGGLARTLEGGPVALDALEKAYGRTLSRFYAGVCGPCRPRRDGGVALAEVHRALRVLLLRLGRAFERSGVFVSAALDGGAPGVTWHRIEIEGELPPGTSLKVQTVTSDVVADLADLTTIPDIGEDEDLVTLEAPKWVPFEDPDPAQPPRLPSHIPDRLIFSPPGRYLRLRLVLGSDGTATPSIRAVRLFYPRVSYLDLLPAVYRRDPESAFFLEHFLALFEHVLTAVEDRYERFSRELNPDAAPLDVLDWLACLIDLSFDPSWPLARRRALVAAAMELYRTRGTVRGLERFVEIYTGARPVILEGFLQRPIAPPFLGQPGSVLGCAAALASGTRARTPEDLLLARFAHRFTVLYFLEDDCEAEVVHRVVDRIVEANKPAHTVHTLRAVRPDAQVGVARLGIDVMLGAREGARLPLPRCAPDGVFTGTAAALGRDSVLGARRPQQARPPGLQI